MAAAETSVFVKDWTPIGEAFEKGMLARDVQMAAAGAGVVLADHTLLEDDGPGARARGEWWRTDWETLCGAAQARKILHVDRPEASAAQLVLCGGPLGGEKAPLEIRINGHALKHDPLKLGTLYRTWEAVDVPPECLRAGDNDILLWCNGSSGWWLSIASREDILRNDRDRGNRPCRSFRSLDGGSTWRDQPGPGPGLPGEYMVRLNLRQYAAEGVLVGPVVDLASRAVAGARIAPPAAVTSVTATPNAETPPGTAVEIELRTGTSPVYDPGSWGKWTRCAGDKPIRGKLGRFAQWRAVLRTDEPTVTPRLRSVAMQAEVEPRVPAWAENVVVTGSHNEEIRYTSVPFEYERFDEPALAELRAAYRLDEIVAGAATEMQMMIRLRNWVSRQWRYRPPAFPYPAWDAREILRRREGFCVQFAIVYMQCALSLGMQTRFTFGCFPQTFLKGNIIPGHEVTEFWSNEYGKWVMMDAHQDQCFVDSRTGVPASMLELHDDQMETYCPDGPLDPRGVHFDAERPSKVMRVWDKGEPAPRNEPPAMRIKWGAVHWMPRNNFYDRRFPEPIAQGRITWSWTGYRHWCDSRTPPDPRFANYTSRRSDVEWTINQVRFAAGYAADRGAVEIRMGTVTPDFDTFLVNVDGKGWIAAGDTLQWQLQPGANRIEMRVQTRAGVLGRVSWLELEYVPAKGDS